MQRIPVLRVADCELEHLGETPGAELAQKQEPGAERARNTRGEHASPGDQLVPELVEALAGRSRRGHPLAAKCERLAALR